MIGPSKYVAEVHGAIDDYRRTLLTIEGQLRDAGDVDSDLLNTAFRAMHTVHGLSKIVGPATLTDFSDELERAIDKLRLGILVPDLRALELLLESADLCHSLLASSEARKSLLGRVANLFDTRGDRAASLVSFDDSIVGRLTDFEQHRLRENVRRGRRIFRVRVDPVQLNRGFSALQRTLEYHGEIVGYLPSTDSPNEDRMILDILVGSSSSLAELAAIVDESGLCIEVLARTSGG